MILFTQCCKKRKKKKRKEKKERQPFRLLENPLPTEHFVLVKTDILLNFLIIFSPPIQAVYSTSGYSWWNGVCGDWLE